MNKLVHGWIEEVCDWPLHRGRIIGAFRSMTGCSGAKELREDESFPTGCLEARRNFFDQLMRSPRGTGETSGWRLDRAVFPPWGEIIADFAI